MIFREKGAVLFFFFKLRSNINGIEEAMATSICLIYYYINQKFNITKD